MSSVSVNAKVQNKSLSGETLISQGIEFKSLVILPGVNDIQSRFL